jgi:hypothetical protein
MSNRIGVDASDIVIVPQGQEPPKTGVLPWKMEGASPLPIQDAE